MGGPGTGFVDCVTDSANHISVNKIRPPGIVSSVVGIFGPEGFERRLPLFQSSRAPSL